MNTPITPSKQQADRDRAVLLALFKEWDDTDDCIDLNTWLLGACAALIEVRNHEQENGFVTQKAGTPICATCQAPIEFDPAAGWGQAGAWRHTFTPYARENHEIAPRVYET